MEILTKAIENIKPGIEIKRRKAGSTYQRTPVKVGEARNLSLALGFLKNSVRSIKIGKPTFEKLAEEINNAYNKSGISYKKKEAIYKEAESTRVSANL